MPTCFSGSFWDLVHVQADWPSCWNRVLLLSVPGLAWPNQTNAHTPAPTGLALLRPHHQGMSPKQTDAASCGLWKKLKWIWTTKKGCVLYKAKNSTSLSEALKKKQKQGLKQGEKKSRRFWKGDLMRLCCKTELQGKQWSPTESLFQLTGPVT